ncbi:hypothetical protein PanWU01x14_234490 [Parasponia andersonii]|uniref:Uncharacterized protein n=1 Tax=Parasponia andersonii TaxID=3476 RepID=A0A2P5BJ11_PARAD|nr:hypothetical protein PanWU01x14_234490 [Parasponia andersonii]
MVPSETVYASFEFTILVPLKPRIYVMPRSELNDTRKNGNHSGLETIVSKVNDAVSLPEMPNN